MCARLPSTNEIIPIYATIVFPIFSWTIFVALYNLSIWLNQLVIGELLILLTYILGISFIESLILLAGIVILAAILPAKFLRDQFVPQAGLMLWLIFILAFAAQMGQIYFTFWDQYAMVVYALGAVSLAAVLFLPYFVVSKYKRVVKFMEAFANRLTVFLAIYIPVGVVSLVTIILRNLL